MKWNRLESFWKRRKWRRWLADLKYFRENDNRGLLLRRLDAMPGVIGYTIETGGFKMGYCRVKMSDGYEVTATGLFSDDILRKAATRVVLRLRSLATRK